MMTRITAPSLYRDYIESFKQPGFWIYSTWLELVSKYRRSRLGIVWAFLPPILYMFGIGHYYSHMAGRDAPSFVPHLGLGYILYRLVVSSLSESTSTFNSHASFIMDGKIRLTDYVLRCISKAMFYFLIALPVLAAVFATTNSFHVEGMAESMAAFIVALLNVGWMVIVVAILGARYPDVQEFIGSILMFALLFTPILWDASIAPPDTTRGFVARFNPLFHIIETIRAPLLGETVEYGSYVYLLISTVVGWIFAAFLYKRYSRLVPIWI